MGGKWLYEVFRVMGVPEDVRMQQSSGRLVSARVMLSGGRSDFHWHTIEIWYETEGVSGAISSLACCARYGVNAGFRASFRRVLQGMRTAMAVKIKFLLVVMFFVNSVHLAHAQPRRAISNVEDQPGYVPSAAEEQLDMAFQRQPVYFRTTEPPGTIIVHTSARYMYLIQGDNRAIRY